MEYLVGVVLALGISFLATYDPVVAAIDRLNRPKIGEER
ncbi:MAG: hypothetical protein JWO04_2888 [Gammaproteobacteria bacterium]|nr:hypothetical protein [Gammaproteobacteria bacterium]